MVKLILKSNVNSFVAMRKLIKAYFSLLKNRMKEVGLQMNHK